MKDWNKYNFVIASCALLDSNHPIGKIFEDQHRGVLVEIFSHYAEILKKEKPEIKARVAIEKSKKKRRLSPAKRKEMGEKLRVAREKYISVPTKGLPAGITVPDLTTAGIPRSTAYKYASKAPLRITSIQKIEATIKEILADRKRSK